MSVSVTINGTSYTIPTTGETGWGSNLTTWIQAASQHLLQKTGGAFTLTAEVNFGATYGLKSVYYKSSAGTVSTTGAIRLGASDLISWRNNANTQDLELSVDSNDRINFNGQPIISSDGLDPLTAVETDNDGALRSSVVTRTELGRLQGILSAAVGLSDSQTLTNKTIDGDSNTVQDLALASLKIDLANASKFIVRDASGVVVSNTKGVPVGDVVGTSDSQILTTKTIDADLNTITNIENADIKSGAAIARNKLASGTISHVVINDGSGVMSSEAQLATSRGGTGVNSTATFPTSGTVVTEAASQSLTNKTIDADQNTITNIENADIKVGAAIDRTKLASGTANHVLINNGSGVMSSEASLAISRGGTGATAKTDAFDALAPTTTAGDFIVYNGTDNVRQGIGSDGQVLVVDTTQTNKLKWTSLQQGAKNYITYNNFENNALTGWNEASVTWTSGAPSGAPTVSASAAASIALSVTSTTPLAGTYSLQMVGTIAQGQGFCTDALTIDREDQAKVLQGSFYYEVTANPTNANFSGTSSNTLCVYIYDVTNSAWIQPAGVYNLVQSSGQGLCTFTFQTPASISQLRLFVFAANTASGSITVNFDDFALGPQKILSGAAVSDEVAFTPTLTGITAIGNGSLYFRWKRVGDYMHIIGDINAGSTTTYPGGSIGITLPSGFSQEATEQSTLTGLGQGYYYDPTTAANRTSGQVRYSAGYYYVIRDGGSFVTNTSPSTWTSGTVLSFNFRVKIAGWSSNTVMSSDTDTRVVAGVMSLASGQTISATTETKVQLNTAEVNTHGTCDITTNYRCSAPVAGVYDISGAVGFQSFTAAEVAIARIKVNGTIVTAATSASPTGTTNVNVVVPSKLVSLNAGDYVELFAQSSADTSYTVGNSATTTFLSVKRLSGPATIAASESISFSANTNTASSVGTSDTVIVFEDLVHDTHSAYSISTGIFTAPVAGTYCFGTGTTITATNLSTAQRYISYIVVDGVNKFLSNRSAGNGTSIQHSVQCTGLIKLTAGQQVKIAGNSSVATTLSGGADGNYFYGYRVGN